MALPSASSTYPLSFAQTGMLLDTLAHPDGGFHIEQLVCETAEKWDADAFWPAWEHVLSETPVLRTLFSVGDDGQLRQEVADQVALLREESDWQKWNAAEVEKQWTDWLANDRQRGFVIGEAPWMRLCAFRLAPARIRWVWTFHHALLDGRSIFHVLDLLFASLDAVRAGRPLPKSSAPPYASFISWLQTHLEETNAKAEIFWRGRFAKFNPAIDHAAASSSSRTALGARDQIQFELDETGTAALHDWCQRHGITTNTVCQAAWALAFGRCAQTDDVVIGAVRSGRHDSVAGAEAMAGVIMNTTPVRVQLRDSMPVLDWLQDLRRQHIELRLHEHSPMPSIHAWIGWPSQAPLFESLVVFERYGLPAEMGRRFGLNGLRRFSLLERSSVPLILSIADGDRLQFKLVYDTVRHTNASIARLRQYLATALHDIPLDPMRKLGALDLMTKAEREELAQSLSGPVEDFPAGRRLHDWVDVSAAKHADRLAIIAPDASLNYAALKARSEQIMKLLRLRGAASDQLVGVCIPRSAGLLAAILGISRSGAAYLPLDPALPMERLRELALQASPIAIITDRPTRKRLPPEWDCLIPEEAEAAPSPNPSPAETASESTGSNLAYAIFTSGSTGGPKLVGIEDRQISNLLQFATGHVVQAENLRWVPFIGAISGDACILQIFGALALGGTLVALPDLLSVTTSEYADRWTFVGGTPSMIGALLESGGFPPAIRLVGMGAEVIPQHLLERLIRQPHVQRIVNYYGPTETTIYSTMTCVWRRSDAAEPIMAPNAGRVIGRPISNTRICLLDVRGHWVPRGSIGEIWIAGEGVARGYLRALPKDCERFASTTSGSGADLRMYRTGDLARLLPDGQLEFLGRLDEQIKLRGFRIELGEIEEALSHCPGVKQSVAVLWEGHAGEKRLLSYFVPERGHAPTQAELLMALRERLPEHMVPSVCIQIDNLPLTPTGKVDRRALPQPNLDRALPPSRRDPPRNAFEAQLAAIWMGVLGLDHVGVHDDFFELGGHSLLAVRLVTELGKLLGGSLSLPLLFQSPTIALMAACLEDQDRMPKWRSLTPIQPHGTNPPIYFAHGYSGYIFAFMPMRPHLLPDQPAFGLQAIGLDGKEARHTTVEQMAAHYLSEIRAFQPQGPYYVAGYSVGGLIAYELARQIQAQGETVAMLALVDTHPFSGTLPRLLQIRLTIPYLLGRCMFHISRFSRLAPREWARYLKGRWLALRYLLGRNRSPTGVFVPPPVVALGMEEPGADVYYAKIARSYRPGDYPGSIDLFVSDDADLRFQAAWDHLARGGVTRHRIPGKHLEILSVKHVDKFVEALRRVIQQRQAESNGLIKNHGRAVARGE